MPGGLIGGSNQKTPTLAMDVKIATTGVSPGFTATVTGASEPIQTTNLKIVTSWTKLNSAGLRLLGGNTTIAGSKVTAPWGFGPGVSGTQNLTNQFNNPSATFGNYTIMSGTGLATQSTADITSLLGGGWQNLTQGDVVSMNIVYIPSGKAIFSKDIVVTQG